MYRREVLICCEMSAGLASSSIYRTEVCRVDALHVAEPAEVEKEKDREMSVCPLCSNVTLTEPSSSATV